MHTELPSDWSTLLQLLEGLRTKMYDEKIADYVHAKFTRVDTTDLRIDLNEVRSRFMSDARIAATALLVGATQQWARAMEAVEALNDAQGSVVDGLYDWKQGRLDPSFAPEAQTQLVKNLFLTRLKAVWTDDITIDSVRALELDNLKGRCTDDVHTFVSHWEALMRELSSFSGALGAAMQKDVLREDAR